MVRKRALTEQAQFKAIYESGITKVDRFVVIRALANDIGTTRFGYSISKKVGNAVTRNRIRRLFREILRALPVKQGLDIVIIARADSANAGYNQLMSSIKKLLQLAGMLKEINEERGS